MDPIKTIVKEIAIKWVLRWRANAPHWYSVSSEDRVFSSMETFLQTHTYGQYPLPVKMAEFILMTLIAIISARRIKLLIAACVWMFSFYI